HAVAIEHRDRITAGNHHRSREHTVDDLINVRCDDESIRCIPRRREWRDTYLTCGKPVAACIDDRTDDGSLWHDDVRVVVVNSKHRSTFCNDRSARRVSTTTGWSRPAGRLSCKQVPLLSGHAATTDRSSYTISDESRSCFTASAAERIEVRNDDG